MSLSLYRKYRPKNFSEIIGQRHIVRTLSNAVQNDRVGHAYLFTGPRGTGKTSIARIFAKTINCTDLKNSTPCEKCVSCKMISEGKTLDIIEIDAASNTGVDNIRELRETVNLQPTALKYKVYIIDEVHMLSTGAFNALLKTLEEPPAHVIFILATTEIHKVPDTIISRCQKFDFTRLPIQNIVEKLNLIAKQEKIKISPESLEMIAIAAEGGMRDAESLLTQVATMEEKDVTVKEVEEILGITSRESTFETADKIISGDSQKAIEKINSLLEEGYDLKVFTKSLINYLRQLMLLKISPELKSVFSYELTEEQLQKMIGQAKKIELIEIIRYINLFSEAREKTSSSMLPQLPLEIAIIKATGNFPEKIIEYRTLNAPKINSDKKIPSEQKPEINIAPEKEFIPKSQNFEVEIPESTEKNEIDSDQNLSIDDVKSHWNKLLEDVKPYNHSLKALLSNCQIAKIQGKEIILATPYDFYKEKLNDGDNRLTVEKVLGNILGFKITIKILTNKEAGITVKPVEAPKAGKQNSLISSALEIMGGKIVNN